MITPMTRPQWLAGIRHQTESVGECEEWQGRMLKGKTPVTYTPRNFLFEGNTPAAHSVRSIVWMIETGARPGDGRVIRMKCQ